MFMSDRDRKSLWSRAANRCSYNFNGEKCNIDLLKYVNANLTALGDECFIVGETEKDPRYIEGFPERITYWNAILLCKEHHKLIDSDPKVYTEKVLHEMRDNHEAAVMQTIKEDPNRPPLKVSDAELLSALKRSQKTSEIR